MNLIHRLFISTFIAALYVGFDIFTMKVGGDIAGGIHYEPHDWSEIYNELPKYIFCFIFFFIGSFIYNSLSKKKNLICPNCEHAFISYKTLGEANCPKCSEIGEQAGNFYKRHPEMKK